MEKYDGVLKELAALLVPHMIDSVIDRLVTSGMLTTEVKTRVEEVVQERIEDLGLIDKDMIREVCEEVVDASDIDDKVSDYMTNSFDISDWHAQILDLVDVDSAVEEHFRNNLHDEVQTAIQGLSFTVEVSTR